MEKSILNFHFDYLTTSLIPFTWGGGRAGNQFPSFAAFPRWSRIPRLPQRWGTVSASSCPVCLAKGWTPISSPPSGRRGASHERQESQALPPARFFSPTKLPLVVPSEKMEDWFVTFTISHYHQVNSSVLSRNSPACCTALFLKNKSVLSIQFGSIMSCLFATKNIGQIFILL